MNAHNKPPFRRRRLGRRLRALRLAANMAPDEAADRLDLSRSSLFRLESGETRATVHVVRSMMDLYDQFDDGLLDAVRAALKPSWFTPYGVKDFGYLDLETEANLVSDYAAINLPGLLQTEPYIRTVFARVRRHRSPEQVSSQVKVRLIRKQRLTNEDNPLELVTIITGDHH